MAAADGLQLTYLVTLNIYTSEHIKLYNKAIVGLRESDRYVLTRFGWTEFYQELEDAVSEFLFKVAVLIVTFRDALHAPTEVKYIIMS